MGLQGNIGGGAGIRRHLRLLPVTRQAAALAILAQHYLTPGALPVKQPQGP